MIYLIGGAPRSGKSVLGQQFAAKQGISWISTDLLVEILKAKNVTGGPTKWDASPAAITATAAWFYPCLERFVWGAGSLADDYVIDGVNFLPAQIAQLATEHEVRAIFLGCAQMTLERFDRFPGRSHGYARLPEATRRQFVADVPRWSEFVQQEAERFGYPYIDTSEDFTHRLQEAETLLTTV